MKLGNSFQMTIGTSDAENSYSFYKKLGFRKLANGTTPFNWVKITDDSLVILLYENGDHFMGPAFFCESIQQQSDLLINLGVKFAQNNLNEKVFIAPDDVVTTLASTQKMVGSIQDQKTWFNQQGNQQQIPNPWLGIFAELTIPTKHIEASKSFWESLGFKSKPMINTPHPHKVLQLENSTLGLHENPGFDHLAITYYHPNVDQAVEQLEENGIYAISEYNHADSNESHYVIHTPEHQRIFLFPFGS